MAQEIEKEFVKRALKALENSTNAIAEDGVESQRIMHQLQQEKSQTMKNGNTSCGNRSSSISDSDLDNTRNEVQHRRDKVLRVRSVVLSVALQHHC